MAAWQKRVEVALQFVLVRKEEREKGWRSASRSSQEAWGQGDDEVNRLWKRAYSQGCGLFVQLSAAITLPSGVRRPLKLFPKTAGLKFMQDQALGKVVTPRVWLQSGGAKCSYL